MSDEPNAKRRRTDHKNTKETSEPVVTRSADYWFDDGTIILQVESTQFRIHKSLLSLHSSVFRDMFRIPLPPDEPILEGCTIVALSGDTVQDWICLLNTVYPKDPAPPIETNIPSLAVISAFLRLGKKYDFSVFQKSALQRLEYEFPNTLAGLENRIAYKQIAACGPVELSVLDLAREMHLHSVLPMVYLDIITYVHLKKTLDDGILPPAEQLTCFRGHSRLMGLQTSTILEWLYREEPISSKCLAVDKCNTGRDAIVKHTHNAGDPMICVVDNWSDEWDDHLCSVCLKEAKKIYNSGREKCWDQLPSIFGLPDWPELLAADFDHE